MLLKTIYSNHNNDSVPYKLEAVDNNEVHLTMEKVGDAWSVYFNDKTAEQFNLKPREFRNYSDADYYFSVCASYYENMVNSQKAREEAEKELAFKDKVAQRDVKSFSEWVNLPAVG